MPVYSYKNKRATEKPKFRIGQNKDAVPGNSIASIKVPWNVNPQCKNNLEKNSEIENCARDDKNFVALSISGGGSRSAIFSAAVMFELQNHKLSGSENTKDISLLDQIDVISSVSGGSLTAAYYALSCDDKNNCPETVEQTKRNLWEPKKVYKKLSKSFQTRWVLNTFWPENIFRLWFTNFDRTDVFAETLSDNIYDTSILGGEAFRFQDLNRRRPNLIINASDNTEDIPVEDRYFTFTEEDFNKIKSDLRQFPVGNAVSASSAFPTVFNYATIRDYSYEKKRYRHLFDAGTYDNLGLYSIKRVIKDINLRENTNPEWINALKIVFLIDSHTDRANRKKSNVPEVKGFLNYFVDLSFLDSYDSMLSSFRYQLLETFHSYMNENGVKHHPLTVFSFDSLLKIKNDEIIDCPEIFKNRKNSDQKTLNLCLLNDRLHRIPTRFKISNRDEQCLKLAARVIVNHELSLLNSELISYNNEMNLPHINENLVSGSSGAEPGKSESQDMGNDNELENSSTDLSENNTDDLNATDEKSNSQQENSPKDILLLNSKLSENGNELPDNNSQDKNIELYNYKIEYLPASRPEEKKLKCQVNGKTIKLDDLPANYLEGIRNLSHNNL